MNFKKLIMEEIDNLKWISDIPGDEPDWNSGYYDLLTLELLTFHVGSNGPVYGFCYGCIHNVDKIIIYDTAYPPMSPTPNGSSNGGTWSWDDLRVNFISGSWVVISTI